MKVKLIKYGVFKSYNRYFTPIKVGLIVFVITFLSVLLFCGLSTFVFISLFMEEIIDKYFVNKLYFESWKSLLWMCWYPFHLILVLIVTIVLVVIYKKISTALKESFWGPLFYGFKSVRAFCCQKRGSRGRKTDTIVNFELTTKAENITDKNLFHNASTDENTERKENNFMVESNMENLPNDNRTTFTTANRIKNQQKDQQKITSAFFFVSFFFIMTAIPNTILVIIMIILVYTIESNYLIYAFVISQNLYGLVFLLNPFLYLFSNQFVMNKLRVSRNLGSD